MDLLGLNSFHHTVLFKTFLVVLDLELNSFHHTVLLRHWWFSIFSSPFCLECVDMVERNNHWTLLRWQHTLILFLILFCNVLLDWSWVRQVYLRFYLTSSFCKCLIIPFFNKFIVWWLPTKNLLSKLLSFLCNLISAFLEFFFCFFLFIDQRQLKLYYTYQTKISV